MTVSLILLTLLSWTSMVAAMPMTYVKTTTLRIVIIELSNHTRIMIQTIRTTIRQYCGTAVPVPSAPADHGLSAAVASATAMDHDNGALTGLWMALLAAFCFSLCIGMMIVIYKREEMEGSAYEEIKQCEEAEEMDPVPEYSAIIVK